MQATQHLHVQPPRMLDPMRRFRIPVHTVLVAVMSAVAVAVMRVAVAVMRAAVAVAVMRAAVAAVDTRAADTGNRQP